MAQEYEVIQVSSGRPEEWADPKHPERGTTYYIKVMLKGHNKPVQVGKKKPDALKPGYTIYGNIIEQYDFDIDKFKAELKPDQPQSFSAHASTSDVKPKGHYQPKDLDSIYRCNALNNAVAYTTAVGGTTSGVLQTADTFFNWLSSGSPGKVSPNPPPTKESEKPQTAATPSSDIVVDYDTNEPINIDNIPF
jgi:hypothetical protein